MSGKNNTIADITEFAEPVADSLGLILWDVELVRVGSELTLRFTIDKPDGVGIEDCESFSHAIDPVLDEKDPIDGEYTLQVTSPGVERDLKKRWHYDACVGEKVSIKLFTADEAGKKSYEGTLVSVADDALTAADADGEHHIPYKAISKAATVFDW